MTAQALGLVLTVTSGSEGTWRLPTDPHRTGEAVDLSVAGLTDEEIRDVYGELRSRLGDAFTVLFEVREIQSDLRDIAFHNPKATGPHIHCQRKKGTVWPSLVDTGRRA
jgi:hypothetical protein